jgi:hypothetical protein
MKKRPSWARFGVAGTVALTAFLGLTTPAHAAEPAFQLPFPCGQTWHGNNTASNAHVSPWELDFNNGDDHGKPVLAAAAGTVEIAAYQNSNGYGNLVKIRHGSSNYYTYYAHLSGMTVSQGASVSQGQLIGYVGDTSAEADILPHLHYEVRYGASGYPGNLRPAVFNGVRFPYPDGDVTSRNCGATLRAAKSINGDQYDDLIGIDADGVATVYAGKATGGFATGSRLGPGWGEFSKVGIADSNGDGWADLFAIGGGTLHYWHNNGKGAFTSGVTVGSGWSAMDYVSFADVNGDNKADILARADSDLSLYIGLGGGRFEVAEVVGPGWGSYSRHTAADADADGDGDIWATNGVGDLYFWKGNGASFASGVKVGSGWAAFRQFTSMDVNGDNRADLVAIRTSDDTLWRWLGTGTGTFGQGVQVGNGWANHQLAAY